MSALAPLLEVKQNEHAATLRILLGVGRHLGSQPRANTSMTIMRAPQHGREHGSTLGRNIRLLLGLTLDGVVFPGANLPPAGRE
jgi:hypothetical protein